MSENKMQRIPVAFAWLALISSLIGLTISAQSPSASQPSSMPTSITQIKSAANIWIENTPTKSLVPDFSFVGVNWFDDNPVFRRLLTSEAMLDALGQTLVKTDINVIRYPGGHNIWLSFWNVPTQDIYTALKNLPQDDIKKFYKPRLKGSDRLTYPDFLAFCRLHGLKAIVQLNTQWVFDKRQNAMLPLKAYARDAQNRKIRPNGMVDWTLVEQAAGSATQQVKWAYDHGYDSVVKFWELGNEEYNSYDLGVGYTGGEYARVCDRFIAKIKSVAPYAKFIITNEVPVAGKYAERRQGWTKAILNSDSLVKNKINIAGFSNHNYSTGKTALDSSWSAFLNHLFTPGDTSIEPAIRTHQALLEESGFQGKNIFVTEFNTHLYSSPFAHTWAAGLANADFVLSCVNAPGCIHADYHNILHMNGCYSGKNENKGFGLLHFSQDSPNPIILYPDAQAMGFLNHYLQGDVLKSGSDNPQVSVSAVRQGHLLHLLLINKQDDKTLLLRFSKMNHPKWQGSKILGLNVPLELSTLKPGSSCRAPSEVRTLKLLENKVNIQQKANGDMQMNIPKNTLSVMTFML